MPLHSRIKELEALSYVDNDIETSEEDRGIAGDIVVNSSAEIQAVKDRMMNIRFGYHPVFIEATNPVVKYPHLPAKFVKLHEARFKRSRAQRRLLNQLWVHVIVTYIATNVALLTHYAPLLTVVGAGVFLSLLHVCRTALEWNKEPLKDSLYDPNWEHVEGTVRYVRLK